MATINYENKEAISVNPTIPNKNKVVDSDMNLIKQVGNQILTTMGVYTDDWDEEGTYLIDDIVIYDNRIFKNLTGTNTTTPPTEDTTNWLEVSIRDISGGAEIPIQNTAPANPREDDLWIDTSEESGGTNILDTIFPVGSIVIKADNEDYSNWLGFTWERTLVGRVAVGINSNDTDFDTIGETGGSKQHQHLIPLGFDNGGYLYGYADNDGNPAYGSDVVYNIKRASLTGFTQTDNQPARIGATAPDSSVQPYQVVAYWKRTA